MSVVSVKKRELIERDFEMNFTHTIDTFSLPVAWPWPWRLVTGRVLDLVGHTAPDQFPTQLI